MKANDFRLEVSHPGPPARHHLEAGSQGGAWSFGSGSTTMWDCWMRRYESCESIWSWTRAIFFRWHGLRSPIGLSRSSILRWPSSTCRRRVHQPSLDPRTRSAGGRRPSKLWRRMQIALRRRTGRRSLLSCWPEWSRPRGPAADSNRRDRAGSFAFPPRGLNIAGAYALMGDHVEAVRWLRRTADEGFPCYPDSPPIGPSIGCAAIHSSSDSWLS